MNREDFEAPGHEIEITGKCIRDHKSHLRFCF